MRLDMLKVYVTMGFLLLFPLLLVGQDNKNRIDSLEAILLQKKIRDSLKFEVLEELVKDQSLNPKVRLKNCFILVQLAKKNNNLYWHYKSNVWFGHIYKKIGDLDKALDNYLDAALHAQKLKDTKKEAIVYSAIGSLYKVHEEYGRALDFFNKSIALSRKVGDKKTLAITLNNSAQLYKMDGVYDSALLSFEEAGEIFDSLNYRKGLAYNLGNIGLLYAKQGNNLKSTENLQKAIQILNEIGHSYPIVTYELKLADLSFIKGDISKALDYAHHSLEIAEENDLKEQIRDASLKLSKLYAETKAYEKAYNYHKQFVIYLDSIRNEETIRNMADLRTEYQVAQKQAEVEQLESKRERQNIIFAAMIVVMTLLVFLVFLYYRNYKRKQALNMVITERKEEIEAQRDQLEMMNETKEKFLSIISHDLLGPVNSFKGLSTIMQASIEQQNVADLRHIHKLFNDSVENLSTLLTNLLDWSVTQQGAIPYNPEEINVAELVNELLHLFSNMALNKDINLSSTVGDKILVWADVNSLKTILRNLTSNAIKFTDQGGQITISAILDDEKVGIQVTDSGVGMPQEKIDELLAKDNFKRSSGTKGEKGVGLGLQLVKEFTEMNKGSMSIESTEEVGTKITVYLPVV